jgi:hypothetical protein
MPLPILRSEEIKEAALARLRAAVAAANVVGAPESALKDLYIPKHRYESLQSTKKWPALTVRSKDDGGAGIARPVPEIEQACILHFNGLVATGRGATIDLDKYASQIAAAVLLTLLEDTTFLELFAWVSRLNVEFDDGKIGAEQREYDVCLFEIELELQLGHLKFEPRLPADAADFNTAQVGADLGPIPGAAPPANLIVRQQFDPSPDEE